MGWVVVVESIGAVATTLAGVVAVIAAVVTLRSSRRSANEAQGHAEAAARSLRVAVDEARSARMSADAAIRSAVAEEKSLAHTELVELYQSFRWASEKALSKENTWALVGIMLLGNLLISTTNEARKARKDVAVVQFAALNSQASALLLGLIIAKTKEGGGDGSGALVVDHVTRAIAAALEQSDWAGRLEGLMSELKGAALGTEVMVDRDALVSLSLKLKAANDGMNMNFGGPLGSGL